MRTKLSILCDGIIEAGWLAAVVVVPLFFNVYSSRVFEPDKISLLRSIALLMIAAWLVKAMEDFIDGRRTGPVEGQGGVSSFLRLPLVLPTLLLVGVYVLTTITSVVPRISFWGSYQRLQGTYTLFSYVVVFMLMLVTLRSRQQLERLLTIMVITSFPIALYGIIQHFQLDPLPWAGDVIARVASNMGNAIFVAAYLIMVVPITMGRFIVNLQPFEEREPSLERGATGNRLRGGNISYTILLVLQALCLAYIFGYQLFFLSNVKHVAGGWTFYALVGGSIVASSAIVVCHVLLAGKASLPKAARMATLVLLFAAQSLSLSYFLLLIFRLNYVVVTGGLGAEFTALAALMLLFVVSFWFTFREEAIGSHLLGVLYGFVLVIQLVCIFFTNSRGPWIGLAVGLFVFAFILAVRRRITWLWAGAAAVALAGILFLAVLNIPDSPLASLRQIPYVGRLGQIFETETGTGKVRVLIWEGVIDLISPHEPIGLPPENLDGLNAIRWLVGYGPESMFVAYNRFYPPDLAHYEARNASPDRAHNETFDALATTGLVGFVSYLILFGSLFYYGLKWLGFASDRTQRTIYAILWALGGLVFAVGARLLDGTWRFSGVALAVGITFGFLVYLVIHALVLSSKREAPEISRRDEILLIALFSAIVAHFIEIHFGIAIAATRTYFWVYCALLVVTGLSMWAPDRQEPVAEPTAQPELASRSSRRGRRRRRPERTGGEWSAHLWSLWRVSGNFVILGTLMGLVMATLGYDHVTGGFDVSAGGFAVPWMLTLTWLAGGAIIMFEGRRGSQEDAKAGIAVPLLAYVLLSLGIFVLFTSVHYSIVNYEPVIGSVADLLDYSRLLSNIILVYYGAVFAVILLLGLSLAGRSGPSSTVGHWPGIVALPLLVIVASVLIVNTNADIVRADIQYKQGLNWDNAEQWDASVALYEESIRLAPEQDWYHLFLARGILEKIKSIQSDEGRVSFEPQDIDDFLRLSVEDVASLDRDSLFRSGYRVLTRARELDLLNTDHSANLGRMYRIWAEYSEAAEEMDERWKQAIRYYQDATTLSPRNAQLFNEWGLVYFIVGEYEEAIGKYQRSLELDAEYAETYVLLGDASAMSGDTDAATQAYTKALEIEPRQVKPHIQLCAFLGQAGELEQAAEHCQKALSLSPNDYQAHRNLAIIYRDMGHLEDALEEASIARELAGEEEKASWDNFIAQLEGAMQ
jgi:tetratricopeptide (TPR) repeat protein/O-antigen ligase